MTKEELLKMRDLAEGVRCSLRSASTTDITDQVSNQAGNQVSNQASNQAESLTRLTFKSLDGTLKDIINFCSVPRTAQEILDHIHISNQTKNRNRYIIPLVEAGFMERAIPETPSSPNQKYRKAKRKP